MKNLYAKNYQSSLIILPALFLILIFNVQKGLAQSGSQKSDILNSKITFVTTSSSLEEVLEVASKKTKIPIGLEEQDNFDTVYRINVRDGTLRDLLSQIIKQSYDLQWEFEDGIIHVSPIDKTKSILNTRIKHFQANNDPLSEIPNLIFEQPEISLRMQELNLFLPKIREIMGGTEASDIISLELRDVTLKEVLDKIIRTTAGKFWIVRTNIKKDKVFSIFIK